MLERTVRIEPYEFGEVLCVVVSERDLKSKELQPIIVLRVPLGKGNIEHYLSYSVSAVKRVVPNQISREVFHMMNFFEQKDWRDKLDTYSDFCDNKF